MQAIILAAGMGKRLGELTRNDTKCMVEVNGIRIINRLLENLVTVGLSKIILVIGYQGNKLRTHLGTDYKGIPLNYLENPAYEHTNNIYSLFLARHYLSEEDTLLLESDIVFERGILERLVCEPYPDVAVVDKYRKWMDGTMVTIDDANFIVDFVSKQTFRNDRSSAYYKTVNIYRFSKEFSTGRYIPFLEAYCKCFGNDVYYEQVLAVLSLLNKVGLKALPLNGEKWYEIDDLQDLDIAETLFGKPGSELSGYQKRYGGYWRFPSMLDFAYLVNPYFPTDKMLDELKSNFDELVRQYPSGSYVNRRLVAKHWDVPIDAVAIGNGAAELIKTMIRLLPGKTGVIIPTFEEYFNDGSEVEIYCLSNSDFRYTVADLIMYFKDRGISSLILINPDNPSGNFIPYPDLLSLLDWTKKQAIQLIVDESFVDFSEAGESVSLLSRNLLEKHSQLVVIKSLSKSHGIPGLRLGVVASADYQLIEKLQMKLPIWNINSLAEYYLQILDKYTDDFQEACRLFQEEKVRFLAELRTIDYLIVFPSQANFFLCELKNKYTSYELAETLLKEDSILIKDCSSKRGMGNGQYIRIAIKKKEENMRLIDALKNRL